MHTRPVASCILRSICFPAALSLVVAGPSSGAGSDLLNAVLDRDQAAVAELLSQGTAPDAVQPDGTTALAWAIHLQDHETAERLLAAGADVNTSDEYGNAPLTLACANGDAAMVRALLAAGARPTARLWNGETALMLAAGRGLAHEVKLLIDGGARTGNTESVRGQTALMWAAEEGHTETVRTLIAAGADVNASSQQGFTPLAFAVVRNHLESARVLLEADADPNAAEMQGATPVNMAAAYGHTEVLGLLVDFGADVSAADQEGRTPLYNAANRGDGRSVSKLLAAGADANRATASIEDFGSNRSLRPPDGEDTPLLAAARGGHIGVMHQLIVAGADPKARTQGGTTLLMRAASSGKLPVVEYAHSLDSEVTATTRTGRTVMHSSVIYTSFVSTPDEICAVIRFLADKGADADAIDAGGRTAISIADIWPIEQASSLLHDLIVANGRIPRILPTNLQ